jgi:hypothetical protein
MPFWTDHEMRDDVIERAKAPDRAEPVGAVWLPFMFALLCSPCFSTKSILSTISLPAFTGGLFRGRGGSALALAGFDSAPSGIAGAAVSSSSKRQFADVDRARRCQDRNFEMICLHNVCDIARAVRDNVDAGPASQAIIEQARAA